MDIPRYIEVTSAYRDRTTFPLTSEFEIPCGNSRSQQGQTIDAVSNASPILAWHKSFVENANDDHINVLGFDVTYSTTDTTIIEAYAPPNEWRKINGYYNGCILRFFNTSPYVVDDLVLYLDARISNTYSMNTWYDIAGENNATTYHLSPPNPYSGFLFTGPDTYMVIPNSATLNPATLTLETYVSCNVLSVNGIVNKFLQYGIFQNSNSLVGVINNDASMYTQITNSVEIGKWVHIVLTYDLSNVIIYIDSIPVISIPYVLPISTNTNDIYIGTTNRSFSTRFPWTDNNGANIVATLVFTGDQIGDVMNAISVAMNTTTTDGFTYSATWDQLTQKVSITCIGSTFSLDFNDTPNLALSIGFDEILYNVTDTITSPNDYFYGDFYGNLLFVRMYNRALNQAEVYKNYQNATSNLYLLRRIKKYTYINSEKAELVLYPPALPDGFYSTSGVIERPMYNTTIDKRFFVPSGIDMDNYYCNYFLQNLDTGEYRRITSYDGVTHLATLEDTTLDDWMNYYTWSWLGGSDLPNQNVIGEPPMRDRPATWVDYKNRVWLYSGANYSLPGAPARPNDLWRLDDGRFWKLIKPSTGLEIAPNYTNDTSAYPGGRYEMATCVDLEGNLLLFGGRPGPYGDLWKYNIDTGIWTWLAGSPGTSIPPSYIDPQEPGSRYAPIVWIDGNGVLWLFGGSGRDDIWKWDGQTWEWVYGSNLVNQPPVYAGPNATPGGRGLAGNANTNYWYDVRTDTLYMYGGYGLDSTSTMGFLEDMWVWRGGSWTFLSGRQLVNQLPVYGSLSTLSAINNPGARVGSACWLDVNGDLWMFGGKNEATGPYTIYGYGCLWKYDKPSGLWVWVSGINIYTDLPEGVYGGLVPHPGIRSSMAFWTDIYGTFYIYGGFGYGSLGTGTLTDLWKFIVDSSNFLIRKEIPANYGWIVKAEPQLLTLQNSFYERNYYINSFVRIIGNRPNSILGYSILPPPYGEERRIIDFTSPIAHIDNRFSVLPVGLWYEILPFSYDNNHLLSYPYGAEQSTIYDVRLTKLSLPLVPLLTGNGGTVLDYPYFYVTLQNFKVSTGGTSTFVYSNNPNARNTTFSVGLSNIYNTSGKFIVMSGMKSTQRIRINPLFDLFFSVSLPTGELLVFNTEDTAPPTPPDPNLQITAVFEFIKVMV